MNSHCQPFRPIAPSSPSSRPEIGAPITVETGTAIAKAARKRRAIFGRIPIGEIEDDAGEEAGLGDAEQEAQDVEAGHAAHQRHQRRDDAPGHHDAGDPAAGAELFQRQIARHLEDEIADEEDAGAPGEDQRRELQFGVHGQRGEAEIDAVEIGEEIGQHQERDQAPGDGADGRGLDFALGCCRQNRHRSWSGSWLPPGLLLL